MTVNRVLITGGASGLGFALAKQYAAQGSEVCIADLNAAAGTKAADDLRQAGHKVDFIACDITLDTHVNALAEELEKRWGKVDVLINNAGVASAGTLGFEDMEQWRWVMDINLFGMVRVTRVLLPLLKKSKSPLLINIASQAGITPIPMMGSYNASKSAVIGFSETMHLELAPDGIHVGVACPGFFATNLDKSLRSKQPGMAELVSKMLKKGEVTADQVAKDIVTKAAQGKFMILTHPSGRLAYRLKRYLPTDRYLLMLKKKLKNFRVKP